MKQNVNSKDKQLDYDFCKVLATILVVVAHITKFYGNKGGVFQMPFTESLNYITEFIYSFHMPLFIFLSEAIYCEGIGQGKYKDVLAFVKNKCKRLLVPYFMVGIFYVAPVMIMLNLTEWSFGQYIYQGLILGLNSRHLWFLWTLFFCFLIVRIMKKILDKGFAVQILVVVLSFVLAVFSNSFTNIFAIRNITYYLFYFLLGYLFHSRKEQIRKRMERKIYLSIPCVIIIIYKILYVDSTIWNIIVAIAGILGCYVIGVNIKQSCYNRKLYKMIQKNSFGIYLIHPMIIYALFYFFKIVNPYLFCAVVLVVTFIVSYLATEILRAMKLKWVLGE